MPDDVGGQPFPDGEEPEYHHRGAANDEFASVVLDEDFVRSAAVHEPTAAERIWAAAQSHAETHAEHGESETARGYEDYGYGRGVDGEFDPEADADFDLEADADEDDEGRFDRSDYAAYADDDDPDPLDSLGYGREDDAFGPYPHPYHPYGSPGAYTGTYAAGIDPGEEHGSDYGYGPLHGVPGARTPYRGARVGGAPGGPYRGHVRWQRPVAWVLAVVMGLGMVALAVSALYRGSAGERQEPAPPPATTGVGAADDARGPVRPAPADPEPPAGLHQD